VSHTTRKTRPRIAAQAKYQCGYCQTQERISGIPLTIEHIIPIAHSGTDDEDNLWLSCRLCNETKGTLTKATDPKTGQEVPLFNPRSQVWKDHFAWDETGTQIIGQSAVGRATIAALSLNSDLRIHSRAIWVEAGWHPPVD
jgi:5-methylcytosine-specific restriction endonuclease McrA